MAPRRRRRKCLNCRTLFLPDPRNTNRQRYCSEPDCRTASKTAAQNRWTSKKSNRDYFKGEVHVKRVQEWREQNPGYWRRCQNALQDYSESNSMKEQEVNSKLTRDALQDRLNAQHAVIIGLISHLTGNTLQDNIVSTAINMQQLGQDILNSSTSIFQGGDYAKNHSQPRPDP
jgi:hypothetical protein